jgi:transposase-like protein
LTLRSGWLSQQDHTTFEAFLQPLTQLEWPILAVLSDKQTGLMPAVTKVLPKSRYQVCQAHYLRNLAAPLAEADAAFKLTFRTPSDGDPRIFFSGTFRTDSPLQP